MTIKLLCLLLTIASYYTFKKLYRKYKLVFVSPLVVTPIILAVFLLLKDIPYKDYQSSTTLLSELLQPAIAAFAIPLYKHFHVIKKNALEILIGIGIGLLMSIFVSSSIATLFHFDKSLLRSIIPFTITTPIAMGVSQQIGGVPTITAVFVIINAVIGSALAPFIIKSLRIKNEVAHGILLGTSANGVGTSKAFELSSKSGAISSVSMIIIAIISMFVTPWMVSHLIH
ncbi:LrgB family protein [Heyndrickxia ginsengihumi]|uniref:LrgB family protein n=1 Tax=Heyndrickxia ginsengihumi TaxID=363870 RepID=UPI00046F5F9F|nr:LrgB family protein [Heyndrickxia ginsengihumi]MBE6183739.1 LrgB family protein [Bacillus sp. (in: firmicutes)]MCM3022233.1 LrgB family protein [Heyndrickxia ginsengihumi]